MKQFLLFIIFIFHLQVSYSQNEKPSKLIKNFGFVPIKGNYLYILPTEVSNLRYREYIFWLKKFENEKKASQVYPDTTVWQINQASYSPFGNYYFQHVSYYDYPVVGISYYKAVTFCNWMAARIMETREFKASNIEKIRIRLPSEEEWMLAARGGLPETAIYPWEGNTIRWVTGRKDDLGKCKLNITIDTMELFTPFYNNFNSDGFFTTVPVESYWPNNWGIYNMCGNVAEWLDEKNKAKGGSWRSFPYNARIDYQPENVKDSSSSNTIGFRPVLEIISFKEKSASKKPILNAKVLEEQILLINDTFGAAFYETNNIMYNLYLSESNKIEDTCHSYNWLKHTRYHYHLQYHNFSEYSSYPVVNINYESAVHFCEWLTLKYNQSPDRKYKEVVFKLPTETEWELAAIGNRPFNKYPFGERYFSFYRDNSGHYLANFNPMEEQYFNRDSMGNFSFIYKNGDSTISRGVDGFEFTAPIDSYLPNNLGLFNCGGNVAEMIAKKGISKGGSWISTRDFLEIKSRETYSNCDANLGFRFFMQIKQKW